MKRLVATILLALMTAGCTVGPDYVRPAFEGDAGWVTRGADGSAIDEAWWRRFDDPVLTSLVEAAASDSLDVAVAVARVAEARAAIAAADAAGGPNIGVRAGARREQLSTETAEVGAAFARQGLIDRRRDVFEAGFDAGFELDLFGRVRRGREAALARGEAAVEARRGVQVTVAAEVARTYFALRTAEAERREVEDLVALAGERVELARRRLADGLTTRDALLAARADVERRRAQLPELAGRIDALRFALARLTGDPPGRWQALLAAPAPLPAWPALPAVGLRPELLTRRPDVRGAERALAAAVAEVGVAEAERYPRLSLAGGFALQSADTADLLSTSAAAFSIGPAITLPVFRAGALAANVDAASARVDAARARYEQAVLGAISEVETALTRVVAFNRSLRALEAGAATADERRVLAERLRETGLTDRSAVLGAAEGAVVARRALVTTRGARAEAIVALYKALGGGWASLESPTAGKQTNAGG